MDPIYNVKIKTDALQVSDTYRNVIIMYFESYITHVAPEDLFLLYKFKIPSAEFDADAFETAGGFITQYMSETVFMGQQMFMGGYDIEIPPEEINITNNIAMGSHRIIDSEVELGYTYVYQVIYYYTGKVYSFSAFANLGSITPQQEDAFNVLCIRNRNLTRRAPVPSSMINMNNIEIEQDLSSLYNTISSFMDDLVELREDNEYLYKVYDMEERVAIMLTAIDLFGYGLGKYGKSGTYGITEESNS